MDAEMIKAIASLWLLGFMLFLIIAVVIFKKSLGSLLERFTRFRVKRGQTELEISQGAKEVVAKTEAPPEEQATSEIPTAETGDKVKKLEPTTPDEWKETMLDAFFSGDIEKGEKAFKKVQESEADTVQKLKNEALYLYLRYNYGNDTSALRKLQELAEQKEVSPYAQYWIGSCYEGIGDFDKAARAYEISAQGPQTEKERARDVVSVARCLLKVGKNKEAFARVMNEIGKVTSPEAMSELYEGLASLYEISQEPELRALALEKALESRPNDANLQFRAAYSYSQKGLEPLALLHYKTLLQFKPNDAGALNNIAIQYECLGMSIYSVKFYKKSIELNETLAMANLAYRFMNAGFTEEASQLLDKAKQQTGFHPNVGGAISALSNKEDAESKTEERCFDSAREQRRFLLSFAEAYFTEKPNCPSFGSVWRSPDGIEATITQNEAQIEANWIHDNKKYKFTGQASNRAAKITNYKMNYILLSNTELGFVKDSSGYIYLSPDGQQLFIMNLKEGKHSFMTLARSG